MNQNSCLEAPNKFKAVPTVGPTTTGVLFVIWGASQLVALSLFDTWSAPGIGIVSGADYYPPD